MTSVSSREAKKRLDHLLNEIDSSHEPIQITGTKNRGVLVSEGDWRSIQETLYLLSIPGMRESIIKGMKTPVEKCSEVLRW
jgi:prevent-host-death family protein